MKLKQGCVMLLEHVCFQQLVDVLEAQKSVNMSCEGESITMKLVDGALFLTSKVYSNDYLPASVLKAANQSYISDLKTSVRVDRESNEISLNFEELIDISDERELNYIILEFREAASRLKSILDDEDRRDLVYSYVNA